MELLRVARPGSRTRSILALALFAVVVAVLGLTSVEFRPAGSEVAAFRLASGLAVAVLALTSPRWRPAVVITYVLGLLPAAYTSPVRQPASLAFIVLIGLTALVTVLVFERIRRAMGGTGAVRLEEVRDLIALGLAAAVGAALAGAIGLFAAYSVSGRWSMSALLTSAAGQFAGVVVIAPAGILLRRHRGAGWGGLPRVEFFLQILLALGLILVVFGPYQTLPLAFLPLPALLWCSMRFGVRLAALEMLVAGILVTALTMRGWGPFAGPAVTNPVSGVILTQLWIAACAGAVMFLAVTVEDRNVALRVVRAQEALLRNSFDEALLGMAIVDITTDPIRLVRSNRAAKALLGGDIHRWFDTVNVDDLPRIMMAVAQIRAGGRAQWHDEVRDVVDGRGRWLEVMLAPVAGDDGLVAQVVVQFHDVTARRMAADELHAMALRDSLTGAANRAALLEQMHAALAADLRGGACIGLLFCDLDDFKVVNDQRGHAAGDAALVEVAGRLAREMRDGDTVARIGGDEFVVLCPGVRDEQTMLAIGRRVISVVGIPMLFEGDVFTIRVSVGAVIADSGVTAHDLLRQGDLAMYRAKRAGKGRLYLLSSSDPQHDPTAVPV